MGTDGSRSIVSPTDSPLRESEGTLELFSGGTDTPGKHNFSQHGALLAFGPCEPKSHIPRSGLHRTWARLNARQGYGPATMCLQ